MHWAVPILGAPESGCLLDRCWTPRELNILLLGIFSLLSFFIFLKTCENFLNIEFQVILVPLQLDLVCLLFSGSHLFLVLLGHVAFLILFLFLLKVNIYCLLTLPPHRAPRVSSLVMP